MAEPTSTDSSRSVRSIKRLIEQIQDSSFLDVISEFPLMFLKNFLDLIPCSTFVVDSQGTILIANQAVAGQIEKEPDEIVGISAGSALNCLNALEHPKGCGFGEVCQTCPLRELLLDTINNGCSHFRVPVHSVQGDRNHYSNRDLLISTTQYALSGEPLAVVSIEEITEQRVTEKTLHTLIDSIPESAMLITADGIIIEANSVFASRQGIPKADLPGMCLYDLLPEDTRHEHKKCIEEAIQTRRSTRFIDHYHGRMISNIVTPILDDSQRVNRLIFLGFDVTTQHSMISALRQSEHRYKLAMGAANEGVFDYEPISNIIHYSPRWYTMLGYEPYELPETYDTWIKLLHEEDKNTIPDDVWNLIETGKPWQVEYRMLRKNGTYAWIQGRGQCVERATDGRPSRIIGTHTDVTDKRLAQEQLSIERGRLLSVLDSLPEFVYLQHDDYSIHYANKAFRRLFGDPVGKPCYELLLNRSSPCDECPTSEVIASQVQQTWEWQTDDGRSYLVHDLPFLDADGNRSVLEVGIDISDRIHAEKTMKQERDRAEQYLNIASVIFLALDREGTITLVNREGSRILGRSANELIGKNWFSTCIPPDERDSTRETFFRLMSGDRIAESTVEGVIQQPDQTQRIIEWRNTLLKDADGGIIGTLSSGTDVTEKKLARKQKLELEEQLRHSQKLEAVGQLASGVTHDINNLISAISGNLSLAEEEMDNPEQLKAAFAGIREATSQAAELTRSLLTFSNKLPGNKKFMDLTEAVRSSLRLLQRLMPATITIHSNVDTLSAILMLGNPIQIQQVLLNLCLNARDAMPNGGSIRIHISTLPGRNVQPHETSQYSDESTPTHVQIKVQDEGSGMPQNIRNHIFEPYFTTKNHDVRSGLGLAIVHSIVQDHQGTITVETKEEQGSTFQLLFPVSCRNDSFPKKLLVKAAGEKILIAIQDWNLRSMVSSVLSKEGFTTWEITESQDLQNCIQDDNCNAKLVIIEAIDQGPGQSLCPAILKDSKPTIIIDPGTSRTYESLRDNTILIRKPFALVDLVEAAYQLIANPSEQVDESCRNI